AGIAARKTVGKMHKLSSAKQFPERLHRPSSDLLKRHHVWVASNYGVDQWPSDFRRPLEFHEITRINSLTEPGFYSPVISSDASWEKQLYRIISEDSQPA